MQSLNPTAATQSIHSLPKGSYTGQHDAIRLEKSSWMGGYKRAGAQILKCPFHGPEVPHSVVDDANFHALS